MDLEHCVKSNRLTSVFHRGQFCCHHNRFVVDKIHLSVFKDELFEPVHMEGLSDI